MSRVILPPKERAKITPWKFVPLLYFMQAIPVSLVQDVSSLVYKDLGISNENITRWTSLVALPWALQLLLGPVVDLNSTKRKWTLYGQFAIGIALVLAPFLLQLDHAFELSLAAFFVVAIFSTLCNVATDGYYLLVLPQEEQAKFAGVQSACYRLGTLFCKGLLVVVVGKLINQGHLAPMIAWTWSLLIGGLVFLGGALVNRFTLPKPRLDTPAEDPSEKASRESVIQTLAIVGLGLSAYFGASSIVKLLANLMWSTFDRADGRLKGWHLSDRPMALGISIGNSGVTAEFVQLGIAAIAISVLGQYALKRILPSTMGKAFTSYFEQPGILAILSFLMFYRFGEAMVSKMSPLFLKDSPFAGGLGFDLATIGQIKGVVGVAGIVLGGLSGGYVVSKLGLKKSFWIIAILMHLPNFLYLWASITRPTSGPIYFVDFCEQFGYGFGFAGYMIFQMLVARRGNFPTSHYAIGVGVGALFISVAGIFSGIIQSNFGYTGFFILAIVFTIPGLLTLFFIPLDLPGSSSKTAAQ